MVSIEKEGNLIIIAWDNVPLEVAKIMIEAIIEQKKIWELSGIPPKTELKIHI